MNGLLAGLGYPVIAVISVFFLSVVGFVLYGMTAKKRGGKVSLEREADGMVEKSDMEQAVKWYKKSADNGYSMAKIKLAGLYLIGYGVEKDVERAVKIYREESAAGDEYATYRLGLCYLEGTGMDKDEKKAVALFEKSSELPFSKYRLAVCLLDGVGTAKDEARAFSLLTEADKDIADADIKDKLSECLYYGKGTSADRDEANRLWREAEEIRKNEEYI